MPRTTRAIVQTAPRALELRELPVPEIDADSAILRIEAPWVRLDWPTLLNVVALATAHRCALVVGKRNPPKPAATAGKPAPAKPAPPKGLEALQKQQPELAARLAAAVADLRSGEPARLAAGLANCQGSGGGGRPARRDCEPRSDKCRDRRAGGRGGTGHVRRRGRRRLGRPRSA